MKIFSVYRYDLIALKNFFNQGGWPKWLVAILFVFVALISAVVIFFFFKIIFEFLVTQEQGLQVLTFYSLGVAFFLIFGLLLISNLLFFSRHLFAASPILTSLPLSPIELFTARFVPGAIVTSWPVYIIGIPILLSLVIVHKLALAAVFSSILLLTPLVLIALSWSTILIFVLSKLLGRLTFKFIVISLIILIPLLGYITISTLFPESIDSIFSSLDKEAARKMLLAFPIFSDFLPSAWFTKGIWGLVEMETNFFVPLLSALWSTFLVSLPIVYVLAKYSYIPLLQKFHEGTFFASPNVPKSAKKLPSSKFYQSKLLSLIKKEVIAIIRDPQQISYVGFLLLMFFIYLFALLKAPPLEGLDPIFAAFILVGNFSFISYIQTILGLRFAYPSISLEGKSAWVLWSIPAKVDKILQAKASVYIPSIILIGIILTAISGLLFSFSPFLWWVGIISNLIVGGFVAAVPLTIGAIFPNFDEQNQEAASTSASGLLAGGICLVAVASFSFVLWNFFKGYFLLQFSDSFSIQPVLDFLVVTGVYSVVLIWFLFHFAGKKIRQYDF